MFKQARVKLTAWYLAIIMVISLSFSVVIYVGVNRELVRFENAQTVRQHWAEGLDATLRANGLPIPPDRPPAFDSETIEASRIRIISVLGLINLAILALAGGGGYFLAGLTLEPIKKNMDEQKEFVSNASHELRTPLTSLTSEIEVALRDKNLTNSNAKNLLRSNLDDVKKMSKLTNYLLEMNRFENKKGDIPMTKVDLKSIVETATAKMGVNTNLKHSVVEGNEDALTELVTILVDNAIKYSPKGKKVEVRTRPGGILEVEDHGKGISAVDIPHIFERFYRSDKSHGTDGYGLGLSIAKSIVDAHGGKISVVSRVGKGSKFTVVI